MTRRTERVGTVIQKSLSEYILRELSDSRLGFLTLAHVITTPDLGHARISVSVMGTEKEKSDTLEALNEYAPRMRSHLSKILQTRTVPKLVFELDRKLDQGFRIDSLLKDLEDGKNPSLKDDED